MQSVPMTFEILIPSRRGVLDTSLGDKVCQQLATGRWFSQGIPASSTKKTNLHDIIEILLKPLNIYNAICFDN